MILFLNYIIRVDQQFSGQSTSYTLAEAQAIMEELRNIQKSLSCGEKEKAELMQVSRGFFVKLKKVDYIFI